MKFSETVPKEAWENFISMLSHPGMVVLRAWFANEMDRCLADSLSPITSNMEKLSELRGKYEANGKALKFIKFQTDRAASGDTPEKENTQ